MRIDLAKKRFGIPALLTWVGLISAFSVQASESVDPGELEAVISHQRNRVAEFADIALQARSRGLRVFLSGGSAASLGDFAKHQLLEAQGRMQIAPERLKEVLNNILLPDQDIDIAITRADGKPETLNEIRSFRDWVQTRYPHRLGNGKSRWDVLGLKTGQPAEPGRAPRLPLLENMDFSLQNNDSLSIGLIELTDPPAGESIVRDLFPTGRAESLFLKDLAGTELTFLNSFAHSLSSRARDGMNPEIISVIRALTKAFQFQKKISDEDMAEMRKIVRDFKPSSIKPDSYAGRWIEAKGRALVVNAYDPKEALQVLKDIGLRRKLLSMDWLGIRSQDSLSWWLMKDPLPMKSSTQKAPLKAVTADSLGITKVAHETDDTVHRLITWPYDGRPRAFSSRRFAAGEAATYGKGFYTQRGDQVRGYNKNRSGQVIVFDVDPKAVQGVDFEIKDEDVVLWKNTEKLRVRHSVPNYRFELGCSTLARQKISLLSLPTYPLVSNYAEAIKAFYQQYPRGTVVGGLIVFVVGSHMLNQMEKRKGMGLSVVSPTAPPSLSPAESTDSKTPPER